VLRVTEVLANSSTDGLAILEDRLSAGLFREDCPGNAAGDAARDRQDR
jgi:hypothetical protein